MFGSVLMLEGKIKFLLLYGMRNEPLVSCRVLLAGSKVGLEGVNGGESVSCTIVLPHTKAI